MIATPTEITNPNQIPVKKATHCTPKLYTITRQFCKFPIKKTPTVTRSIQPQPIERSRFETDTLT